MTSAPTTDAVPEPPLKAARWHVDRTALVAKIIGVVAFALIPQVLSLNAGSRWFGLLLALVFAVYAPRDVVAPVRLSADAEGVTVVKGYAGHRRLPWSEIERLRVGSQRRAEFLEVDTGDSRAPVQPLRPRHAADPGAGDAGADPAVDGSPQMRQRRSGGGSATPWRGRATPGPDQDVPPGPGFAALAGRGRCRSRPARRRSGRRRGRRSRCPAR